MSTPRQRPRSAGSDREEAVRQLEAALGMPHRVERCGGGYRDVLFSEAELMMKAAEAVKATRSERERAALLLERTIRLSEGQAAQISELERERTARGVTIRSPSPASVSRGALP